VLAAVLLSGCGVLGGGDSGKSSGQSQAQEESSGKENNKDAGKSGKGHGVAQAAADLKNPLATVETTVEGGAPLHIHLLDATVDGKLLRVQIGYEPGEGFEGRNGEFNAYRLAGESSPSPYLLDPVNLKKYSIVRASGAGPLETDTVFAKAKVGDVLVHTYYFAAPPADVKSIQFAFGGAPWPGFEFEPAR
jgi:hypothetical protein